MGRSSFTEHRAVLVDSLPIEFVSWLRRPEPLLAEIASHFEDLADPLQFEPWRLVAIDTSRGRSRNRELHHPCYILVDFCAFRSFGLRPQGVVEWAGGIFLSHCPPHGSQRGVAR